MKIALVGIGKIARDQHVPAIAASGDWELAATVSRAGTVDGVEAFTDMATMLEARPDIPVVSLCLPPQPRFSYAEAALAAGRHVMLEKPPGQTLSEVHALTHMSAAQERVLYATWHSRMAPAVAAARSALAGEVVSGGHITWREDVRRWHPGQEWVFEPGGMGVLDPGINALSVLTEVLPAPVHLLSAELEVPENRQTPIAAQMTFSNGITADMDWRQEGPQTWEIVLETASGGRLHLVDGGARGSWNGTALGEASLGEYPGLYARMAELVAAGQSDVDLAPMTHISDAMTLGRRHGIAPFHF